MHGRYSICRYASAISHPLHIKLRIAGEETVHSCSILSFFLSYFLQTSGVMESFILAMVRHPEAYKKAQEEIDRVVGNERLPTLDDREALPYLDCVLKEVLR